METGRNKNISLSTTNIIACLQKNKSFTQKFNKLR